jgi:F-type H+-transporting ATPase subunit epsilon
VSKTILVEFTTPDKPVFTGEADSVSLPAYDGSMGVLPGHTPLVAQLVPGVIHVRKDGEDTTFAVTGGFVEVRPKVVSIFAESAEQAEEINAETARIEAEKIKARLVDARRQPEADVAMVELELLAALARLKAVQSLRHRHPQHPPRA